MKKRGRLSRAYKNYVRERRFWKRRRRYEALNNEQSDDGEAQEPQPKRALYKPPATDASSSESDDQVPETQDLLMYANTSDNDSDSSQSSGSLHIDMEAYRRSKRAEKAALARQSALGGDNAGQEGIPGPSQSTRQSAANGQDYYTRQADTVSMSLTEVMNEPVASTSAGPSTGMRCHSDFCSHSIGCIFPFFRCCELYHTKSFCQGLGPESRPERTQHQREDGLECASSDQPVFPAS